MRKSRRENEWRDSRARSLIGPKAAPASFSHVVRNVRLDRASSEPLYQQLYRQIRAELESGSFDSSASRVPSSRVLAETLGISRPTVNEAFSKLLAEGYLQARKRSGIFVADHYRQLF